MAPNRRADLQRRLAEFEAWLAPHIERRNELAALVASPDDPLETELEQAQREEAAALARRDSWERDQEMCDGLCDGPPMRIPESVFADCDRARVRVVRAQQALRLAGRA